MVRIPLVILFKYILTASSHPGAVFIYISAAAPNRASLGATNGLCQLTVSLFRAVGPALANSLFSLSMEKGYLHGYLVYYVLVALTCVALWVAAQLPHQPWAVAR
jgi:hypothetical protein